MIVSVQPQLQLRSRGYACCGLRLRSSCALSKSRTLMKVRDTGPGVRATVAERPTPAAGHAEMAAI
jgi:hypothetical protein